MPFCGFNQKMLQGMSGFQSGLVEHGIIDRSEKKKKSFEEIMNKELSDMSRFKKEIYLIKNPELRELTEALTNYARAFYKLIQKTGIKNYKETIQFLNKFFWEMDDKYYSELEGKPEDMKKLALYLNTIKSREDHNEK
jgi:RNA processing factor Prp31